MAVARRGARFAAGAMAGVFAASGVMIGPVNGGRGSGGGAVRDRVGLDDCFGLPCSVSWVVLPYSQLQYQDESS